MLLKSQTLPKQNIKQSATRDIPARSKEYLGVKRFGGGEIQEVFKVKLPVMVLATYRYFLRAVQLFDQ